MSGKRAREGRQADVADMARWREIMAQYHELTRLLDEADVALAQAGRRDLSNRLFRASSMLAIHLVYAAPPEIAHEEARRMETEHPEAAAIVKQWMQARRTILGQHD